ncbi:MAG: ankyrin repeat domain-containing protein [Chryseolinea sp.]
MRQNFFHRSEGIKLRGPSRPLRLAGKSIFQPSSPKFTNIPIILSNPPSTNLDKMLPKTPLLDAITQGNFGEAEKLILAGDRLPNNTHIFDLVLLYEKLLSKKAFPVIKALTASRQINTDIYELDRFEDSIYKPLITRIPVDDESLAFIKDFVANSQNINDEIKGYSLLSFAFQEKADTRIIKALIAAGCRADSKNNAEDTLISQVVRINLMQEDKQISYVDLLINEGVSVTDINVARQSALHIAIQSNKNHLIDILLANGAQPNEQDNVGNTAFFYTLAHKLDGPLYMKLAAHTRPDFTLINRERQTALSEYLRMMQGGDSDIKLLEQLIEDGADLNQSTPHYDEQKSGWDWVIVRSIEMVDMALKKTGFDINTQDNQGNTLLHKICKVDSYHSHDNAKNTYRKVKFLLEKGADPSITNNRDETAMMLSATDNLKAKTVELLLSLKR